MNPSQMHNLRCRAWWATSPLPGAIGICHLKGDLAVAFERLGMEPLETGRTRVIDFAGIDEVVVARPREDAGLVMPHGGPRVRQLISRHLQESGIMFVDDSSSDCRTRWPEAEDMVEACMLESLATTESPRAVELLLTQPSRHRESLKEPPHPEREDPRRHLIRPPLIVITGRPNVGKSTLLNRLANTELAITADLEGTTRDAVAGRLVIDGMACDVVDLPGLRESEDPIERRAISLSSRFLTESDLLIGLIDDERDLPETPGRTPDLIVRNKSDLGTGATVADIDISAIHGDGIEALALMIRRRLVPDELLSDTSPWMFHQELELGRG